MTGVTTNTVTGWTVYTISSTTLLTKTITATTTGTPTINILMAGGGGGSGGGGSVSGGGGGGRLIEISKTLYSTTPTQTFTCTIPAIANGAMHGGTTILSFSDSLVGDISCGGGAFGSLFNTSALPNGGSGAGGGANATYGGSPGGAGVFGYKGGGGYYNFGTARGGGGGGAGGAGENATISSNGNPGPGLLATLDGIKSVYPSTTFCSGGGPAVGSTYGGGAMGGQVSATSGNPGVIIIAVPT
jgi:hypothetical protein